MRARIVILVLAAASALLLLAACGGDGRPDASTPTPFVAEGTTYRHGCPTGHMSLRTWLFADISVDGAHTWMFPGRPLTFSRGQPITIGFAIGDCSTVPVTASYPTSQRYEIVVKDADARAIWRWSQGGVFTQAITEERFQSVVYSDAWDQTDSDGRQVPSGSYSVTASLVGSLQAERDGVAMDCWNGGIRRECPPEASVDIEITP